MNCTWQEGEEPVLPENGKMAALSVICSMCDWWWDNHPEDRDQPATVVIPKVLREGALMGGFTMYLYHKGSGSGKGGRISNFAMVDRTRMPYLFHG